MKNNLIVGGSEPNPELVGVALAAVLKWADENGIEPTEAEVAQIVGQYEGVVEPEPFELVVEPLLVERRKSLVVS